MKKGDLDNQKGFTIIEVSLVLAIAGLIMLMMFIALPALQRNARDTERKEDITALVDGIKKYQENHRGALPETENGSAWLTALKGHYIDSNFTDPNGDDYSLQVHKCSGSNGNCNVSFGDDTIIHLVKGAKCRTDGETGATSSSSPRKYAVLYQLENGGIYCFDA